MKKCILSSLLIHVVFWSANGAVVGPATQLPSLGTFHAALTLAETPYPGTFLNETAQSAALELERFFQSTAGQLAQIIPFEEQYPGLTLDCPYCFRNYSTLSNSLQDQFRLKEAFKKHKKRHKEKLYCCPLCEKYFQNKGSLKIHIERTCSSHLSESKKQELLSDLNQFKTGFTRKELEKNIGLVTARRRTKYNRI